MSGSFVAVLADRGGPPLTLRWRIVGVSATGERELRGATATLSAASPELRTNFELLPQGDTLRFEIETPAAAATRVQAGWRALWIRQAGPAAPTPPPAAVDSLDDIPDETAEATTFIRHACLNGTVLPAGWQPAPFEAWRECGAECAPWQVRVNAKRRHDIDGSPTIVFLVWYKGGRIEILREQMVHPADEESLELEGWMPEPGGWMGVFARAADIKQTPSCRVRIESWSP